MLAARREGHVVDAIDPESADTVMIEDTPRRRAAAPAGTPRTTTRRRPSHTSLLAMRMSPPHRRASRYRKSRASLPPARHASKGGAYSHRAVPAPGGPRAGLGQIPTVRHAHIGAIDDSIAPMW